MNNDYPRLLADIGGTNARFAIEIAPEKMAEIITLRGKDFPTLLDAIRHYLSMVKRTDVKHFVIAIANPVTGDRIQMTNHHWHFSIAQMKVDLQATTLLVINDFTAQALAITRMDSDSFTPIGESTVAINDGKHLPMAVVGAGTGLGVSGLIPDGRGRMIALSGEGGHVSFSPRNAIEHELLAFAEQKFQGHVSVERLLQGAGLTLMYDFFAQKAGVENDGNKKPADITHGTLVLQDDICRTVLSHYCRILGDTCANVVLTIGAVGGVYLCGGIVPRFVDFLQQSDFRKSFEDKGRFSDYMSKIPVYVVEYENPGLLGASVALQNLLD